MFKIEAQKPQIVTTSLYNHSDPINLLSFDNINHKVTHLDSNGVVSTIEPLQETKTHLNVELNAPVLTAPLAQIMHLAKVNVYQNDQLIQTFDIANEVNIEQANWLQRLMMWFKSLVAI